MQLWTISYPTSRSLRSLATAFAVIAASLALPPASLANNGEIAYAYPVSGIVIDGDLSDWAEGLDRVVIHQGESEEDSADFSAWFRAGYDLSTESLFVAVEVQDQAHEIDEGSEASWTRQDSHILYLDTQHRREGSGAVLYLAGERFRDLAKPPAAWDPVSGAASWDDAEVAVRREGQRTVYEWRVVLGSYLKVHRSLGIDHLFSDTDPDDSEEDGGQVYAWGEGFGKSANSYRLGDIVPVPSGTELSEVRGQIRWRKATDEPLPSRVRITSADHPDFWVQAQVDATGHYSARLPVGDYLVRAPHRLSRPFEVDANARPLHVNTHAAARATVSAGRISAAPTLELESFERPDFLFRDDALLFDFEAKDAAAIDTFVETFRRYFDVPGASVAILRNGRVAYHRTFGSRNALTGQEVESNTLFEAASISKPVFAYAVMRLAERGVIDLDQPLFPLLEFPNIAGDERSKGLTARIILSHQSGLPNWAWGGPGGWEGGSPLTLDFAPGTRFQYSGEAFNYLGRVLEKVTGKDLETIFQEEVFTPMGMAYSDFALDKGQAETASLGHFSALPVLRDRADRPSPASSLHTSAEDFSHFMVGLAEGKGLKAESYRELFTPVLEVPINDRVYQHEWVQSIGLGFFLQETPYGRLVEHGGNNGDFQCKFGMFPERGDGYAIFTNGNHGDKLMRALEVLLLQGRP